jgi:CRISPR-associated protein Cas1
VPYKKKQYSYQYVLRDNVQTLANYIVDKEKKLEFNVPGVPIKRNDDNETRDFILNMTPEQRKDLGINKSTLWHRGMRQNVFLKVPAIQRFKAASGSRTEHRSIFFS